MIKERGVPELLVLIERTLLISNALPKKRLLEYEISYTRESENENDGDGGLDRICGDSLAPYMA